MLEITCKDVKTSEDLKDLCATRASLNVLYMQKRDAVFHEIMDFLRAHPNEGFTARELSDSTGLSSNAICRLLREEYEVKYRDREKVERFVRVMADGTIDRHCVREFTSKVREYYVVGR